MKKTAVITGGGSFGAYHVGTLKALGYHFEEVYGTSTGALMAPFVASGEYDLLEKAYTSIGQYDIFNGYFSNPIKKDGKINIWKAGLRLARGKKTIGATDKALRKTIQKWYREEMHDNFLFWSYTSATVNAVDLTKQYPSKVEYYSTSNIQYNDFVECMRASASFPGIMSPVYLKGRELVDGGLTEMASIEKAAQQKPDELHVFVHSKKPSANPVKKKRTKNFFHLLMRVITTYMDEVKQNDLNHDELRRIKKQYGIKSIKLYYMHKEYTNRLVFNKNEMKNMVEDGYLRKKREIVTI